MSDDINFFSRWNDNDKYPSLPDREEEGECWTCGRKLSLCSCNEDIEEVFKKEK